MGVNKEGAERAIKNADRELRNGLRSFEERDYAGALKYFQESSEYAVKAVLIAHGLDYPKIHGVGRFLIENKGRFPKWFANEIDATAEVVDSLARNRPKFRYPYEYSLEEYEALAKKICPKAQKTLRSCMRLVQQLFENRQE